MKKRAWSIALATASTALAAGSSWQAGADTQPPQGTPATVSVDPLDTVQVDGIVWSQAIVGNTVYATGAFTRVRPAGAPAGTAEVVRRNLLAYDITTGELLPFNHRLNGQGLAVAASPNGDRVYVGGDFTKVDGQVHRRLAAFNTTTGRLIRSFKGGASDTVRAIAPTNRTVYVGGSFDTAAGKVRDKLAAFTARGRLTGWAPRANRQVTALVVTPDRSKVVIGGRFNRINDRTYFGLGAVKTATGRPVLNWASRDRSFPIRDFGDNAAITSLSTDGSRIFLTGYSFGDTSRPGSFEGRAAISARDGHILWANACHGDSYSAFPIGKVLYSVGHPHDCESAGYFPEREGQYRRALAETTFATHRNGPPTGGYPSFQGIKASEQLVWYPSLSTGEVSGSKQAAWSVVGNRRYVSLGGEFEIVDGKAQQGLVRYAVKRLAPNDSGPRSYDSPGVDSEAAGGDGRATIRFTETWDKDNARLTYQLFRTPGDDVLVCEETSSSRFWDLDTLSCVDDGLDPGEESEYRLEVRDPFGNVTATKNR